MVTHPPTQLLERTVETVAPARPGYLPALDGLRAVSVLAVVAYHLDRLPGGFLGVDVFFAISGFLITRLLLAEHERTGRIDLRAFWARRFRRLLPALLVVLVAVAVGSRLWLPAWRLADVRADVFGALAYVANWRFVLSDQSYFASGVGPSPLRHTWSLAIEEQYYLVWPLVVVGVLRRFRGSPRRAVGATALVVAGASGAWMSVAVAQGRDLSRIYYGTDTRLLALGLGAWLATWLDRALHEGAAARRRERTRTAVALGSAALVPLAALVVAAQTDDPGFYRWGFQLAGLLAVLAIAGAATGEGAVARGLSGAPLRWLGRRSYGLYLWSWPVQVWATEHLRWTGAGRDAVVVVVAVVLAAASFRLVEEPLQQRGRTRSATTRPTRLAPAAVLAVAALAVGVAAGAPPKPEYLSVSDADATEVALAGDVPADHEPADRGGDDDGGRRAPATTEAPDPDLAPGPFSADAPTLVPKSLVADPLTVFGRPMRVMVAGDSMGWSLAWDLGAGLRDDVEVMDRALIGCGVLPPDALFLAGGMGPRPYPVDCAKIPLAEAKGLAARPDVVLLWLGAWEVYDQELDGERLDVGTEAYADLVEGELQARIDTYRAAGIPTVLPLVPCYAVGAPSLGTDRTEPERQAWVTERVRAVAEQNPGWVRLIDPRAELCREDGTNRTETADGTPLRVDGVHFDPPEAVWLWNTWLAEQLAAAFPPP